MQIGLSAFQRTLCVPFRGVVRQLTHFVGPFRVLATGPQGLHFCFGIEGIPCPKFPDCAGGVGAA